MNKTGNQPITWHSNYIEKKERAFSCISLKVYHRLVFGNYDVASADVFGPVFKDCSTSFFDSRPVQNFPTATIFFAKLSSLALSSISIS